jgi:hypothetical protein
MDAAGEKLMPRVYAKARHTRLNDLRVRGEGLGVKSSMSCFSICSKWHGAPPIDGLLPYSHSEDLRNVMTVAAARGTDALAALWCRLTPFQKLHLAEAFPTCWQTAERADVRWRPET